MDDVRSSVTVATPRVSSVVYAVRPSFWPPSLWVDANAVARVRSTAASAGVADAEPEPSVVLPLCTREPSFSSTTCHAISVTS